MKNNIIFLAITILIFSFGANQSIAQRPVDLSKLKPVRIKTQRPIRTVKSYQRSSINPRNNSKVSKHITRKNIGYSTPRVIIRSPRPTNRITSNRRIIPIQQNPNFAPSVSNSLQNVNRITHQILNNPKIGQSSSNNPYAAWSPSVVNNLNGANREYLKAKQLIQKTAPIARQNQLKRLNSYNNASAYQRFHINQANAKKHRLQLDIQKRNGDKLIRGSILEIRKF